MLVCDSDCFWLYNEGVVLHVSAGCPELTQGPVLPLVARKNFGLGRWRKKKFRCTSGERIIISRPSRRKDPPPVDVGCLRGNKEKRILPRPGDTPVQEDSGFLKAPFNLRERRVLEKASATRLSDHKKKSTSKNRAGTILKKLGASLRICTYCSKVALRHGRKGYRGSSDPELGRGVKNCPSDIAFKN